MPAPRFLADQNLNERIVDGLRRRSPDIEFARARQLGLDRSADRDILLLAAERAWVVVSHDVSTMPAAATAVRDAGGVPGGLIMVRQTLPIRTVLDQLFLIWSTTDAHEWPGQVVFLPL
jgi:hypothetical protein